MATLHSALQNREQQISDSVKDREITDCYLQITVIGANLLMPTNAINAAEVDLLVAVSAEYDASLQNRSVHSERGSPTNPYKFLPRVLCK